MNYFSVNCETVSEISTFSFVLDLVNYRYVLPNHMLLQIAEMLPREMQGILACCNPVPSLVRKNLSHLHQLISVSRHLPINRVSYLEER